MRETRLRLAQFCQLIGEDRGSVLAIISRGSAPFRKEMPKGAEPSRQRTYDGADLLAWCLFSRLRAGGMVARRAGESVLLSRAVPGFFAAAPPDHSDLNLIVGEKLRRRGYGNDRDARLGREGQEYRLPFAEHGDSDHVRALLESESGGYGAENRLGETRLGLVTLTVVPILPCFHAIEGQLEKEGFAMRGASIIHHEDL